METVQPVRMKKRKMFLNVANTGTKVVSGSIIVQACPNDLGLIRAGFTVTKKIGCAVIRNRTRRRLKEVVRLCPMMADMIGFDLVFIGRLSTKDREFTKLQADLIYALKEIKKSFLKEGASCDTSVEA